MEESASKIGSSYKVCIYLSTGKVYLLPVLWLLFYDDAIAAINLQFYETI